MRGKTSALAFVAMLSAEALTQLSGQPMPTGLSAEVQGYASYEGATLPSAGKRVLAVSANQDDWTAWGGAMRGSPALRNFDVLVNTQADELTGTQPPWPSSAVRTGRHRLVKPQMG